MFGYVRPYAPEMKVAEYERYRGVYCGVCREIGRTSGQLARFGLTYDIVLLCAARMVLTGITPEFEESRCIAHPMKKRSVMKPNEAAGFTAAVFSLLAASKNDDDLADERGARRIKPVMLAPLSAHMKKCAGRVLPDGAYEAVASALERLGRLEAAKSPSADDTSDAFGDVLGYLFSLGLEGEAHDTAETIGRSVGKFCYMCDAVDDLADDEKRGRYNALGSGWGELALEDGKVSPIVKEAVSAAAMISLEELGRAVDTLDGDNPMTPIIRHIAYVGLPVSLGRVLDGRKDGKDSHKDHNLT